MATVDDLAREVAALRAELAALRDALATEVRTRRVIVEDGDRESEIVPGYITVGHDGTGCYASLSATDGHAEIGVSANDLAADDVDSQNASMSATLHHPFEDGGPSSRAYVRINGDEVAVSGPGLP